MRIADRSERRLTRKARIHLPSPVRRERPAVIDRELHEKVVRLLTIVNRVVSADLTCREEARLRTPDAYRAAATLRVGMA